MERSPLIRRSLAVSACVSLLEYHGGLWLFHFIIVVNAFPVSFPGLICSAAGPALFPGFPLSHDFCGPPAPLTQPAVLGEPTPMGYVRLMCFARGDFAKPMSERPLALSRSFVQLKKKRRGKAFLVLRALRELP